MKIVSWNCLGPRYNKNYEIEKWIDNINWLKENYAADLYVIQECSKLQADLVRKNGTFQYVAWYGDDLDYFMRGTAIFSDIRCFTEREEFFHNPNFRYVVPYRIQFEDLDFILFNVWTKAKPINEEYENKAYFFYENNVKEALRYYMSLHDSFGKIFEMPKSSLLIGDFNFGKDVSYIKESFGKEIAKFGFSAADGLEDNLNTYIHGDNKMYLNDYCFVQNLKSKLLKAGSFSEIEKRSDHVPLLFDVSV